MTMAEQRQRSDILYRMEAQLTGSVPVGVLPEGLRVERRLFSSPLQLISSGFIAGFTIVFGIVALGIAEALVEPRFGPEGARLVGALAFGIGLVFRFQQAQEWESRWPQGHRSQHQEKARNVGGVCERSLKPDICDH